MENLNLSQHSKVLVIGAYKGADATEIHKRYGCTVYAAEPSNFAFPRLIKVSRGKDIVPLKLAVGEKNGMVAFYEFGYLFGGGEGNSLFKERHRKHGRWKRLFKNPHSNPELWLKKKYKVLCLDLKTLLKHLGYIDVIVCNCEGGEKYIVEQLVKQPELSFGQLAISFHPQIYGERLKCQLVNKMAKYFRVREEKKNHVLFVRKAK